MNRQTGKLIRVGIAVATLMAYSGVVAWHAYRVSEQKILWVESVRVVSSPNGRKHVVQASVRSLSFTPLAYIYNQYGLTPDVGFVDTCEVFTTENGKPVPYPRQGKKPHVVNHVALFNHATQSMHPTYDINLGDAPLPAEPLYCRVQSRFFTDIVYGVRYAGKTLAADQDMSYVVRLN